MAAAKAANTEYVSKYADRGPIGDVSEVTFHGVPMKPMISLVQKASPEFDKDPTTFPPGTFSMKVNNEAGERDYVSLGGSIDVAILKIWQERIYWNPDKNASNKILCSSRDMKMGVSGKRCVACPAEPFRTDGKGCNKQYVLLVASVNKPTDLYRMILAKTGYSNGKEITDILAQEGTQKNIPANQLVFNVSSVAEKNKAGQSYFKMAFNFAGRCDAKIIPQLNDLFWEATDHLQALKDDFHNRITGDTVDESAASGENATQHTSAATATQGLF